MGKDVLEAVGEGKNMHWNAPWRIGLSSRRQWSGNSINVRLMRNHWSQKRHRQFFNHMKLHLILALFTNSGRNFINIVQNSRKIRLKCCYESDVIEIRSKVPIVSTLRRACSMTRLFSFRLRSQSSNNAGASRFAASLLSTSVPPTFAVGVSINASKDVAAVTPVTERQPVVLQLLWHTALLKTNTYSGPQLGRTSFT